MTLPCCSEKPSDATFSSVAVQVRGGWHRSVAVRPFADRGPAVAGAVRSTRQSRAITASEHPLPQLRQPRQIESGWRWLMVTMTAWRSWSVTSPRA